MSKPIGRPLALSALQTFQNKIHHNWWKLARSDSGHSTNQTVKFCKCLDFSASFAWIIYSFQANLSLKKCIKITQIICIWQHIFFLKKLAHIHWGHNMYADTYVCVLFVSAFIRNISDRQYIKGTASKQNIN